MTSQGMTPEIAEVARDVLALIRAALNEEHAETAVILRPLSLDETRQRLTSMALLTANLMETVYGDNADEHMRRFARQYLISGP
jgi:hypothetical protein